jgi:hypothetical protein
MYIHAIYLVIAQAVGLWISMADCAHGIRSDPSDVVLQQQRKGTLRKNIQSLVSSTTPSYSDSFPDKYLVKNLVTLSHDIYNIDGTGNLDGNEDIVTPSMILSGDEWEFQFWIEAQDGTEAMIIQEKQQQQQQQQQQSAQHDRRKTIIIFRGTDGSNDWWTNAEFFKRESKFVNAEEDVEVHGGFQESLFDYQSIEVMDSTLGAQLQWSSVIELLEQKIMELTILSEMEESATSADIYITGHSLG